jgi:hypothetical protein
VSELAATIAAPWTIQTGELGAARALRSVLSVLAAAAVLAVALPVAFGSGARGAGVDPIQVFASGPLVAADASGGAQLSVAGIVPGQSRSAVFRVSNDGTEAGAFSLSSRLVDRTGPGGAPLSGALILRIEAVGTGAPLYSGPIGAMPRLRLGGIAAGGARAYRFTVALAAAAGNEVAASRLSASFAWTAI